MPATVRLWAEHEGFAEFSSLISDYAYRERVLGRILDALAAEIARVAKKNVKKRTSATAQSIAIEHRGLLARAIVVHNIVGLFLEHGTRAHEIAARHAQALMLPVRAPSGGGSPFGRTFGPRGTARLTGSVRSGQVSFFKSVHHPGAQPYPFLIPAYRQSLLLLDLLLLKAGAQIAAHMAAKGEM